MEVGWHPLNTWLFTVIFRFWGEDLLKPDIYERERREGKRIWMVRRERDEEKEWGKGLCYGTKWVIGTWTEMSLLRKLFQNGILVTRFPVCRVFWHSPLQNIPAFSRPRQSHATDGLNCMGHFLHPERCLFYPGKWWELHDSHSPNMQEKWPACNWLGMALSKGGIKYRLAFNTQIERGFMKILLVRIFMTSLQRQVWLCLWREVHLPHPAQSPFSCQFPSPDNLGFRGNGKSHGVFTASLKTRTDSHITIYDEVCQQVC